MDYRNALGRIVPGQSMASRTVRLTDVNWLVNIAELAGKRLALSPGGPSVRVGEVEVLAFDHGPTGPDVGLSLLLDQQLNAACPAACAGDLVFLAVDAEAARKAEGDAEIAAWNEKAMREAKAKAELPALDPMGSPKSWRLAHAKACDCAQCRPAVTAWSAERVLSALRAKAKPGVQSWSGCVNDAFGQAGAVAFYAWRTAGSGGQEHSLGCGWTARDEELSAMADALNRAQAPAPEKVEPFGKAESLPGAKARPLSGRPVTRVVGWTAPNLVRVQPLRGRRLIGKRLCFAYGPPSGNVQSSLRRWRDGSPVVVFCHAFMPGLDCDSLGLVGVMPEEADARGGDYVYDADAILGRAEEPKPAPAAEAWSEYRIWSEWCARQRDPNTAARIVRLLGACGRLPGPSTTVTAATGLARVARDQWRKALEAAREDLARDEAHLAALEAALAEHGEKGGGV